MKTLEIYGEDTRLGILTQDQHGKIQLRYEDDWAENQENFPISLSLPLSAKEHGHPTVANFLWGLLPDNGRILGAWGKQFQVSPNNPFALLSHVGGDCAGAVQFHAPRKTRNSGGEVSEITASELEARIKDLLNNHGNTRRAGDQGSFSLAGAQPKLALHKNPTTGQWGIPSGRTPTTHILKPATGQWEGLAENEHYCGILAAKTGLPGAKSEVLNFKTGAAICAERYDRRLTSAGFIRIHQEDFCQASGQHPDKKYQNEGGPSPKTILDLIRKHCSDPEKDKGTFIRALVFNWLILGTDAHAKNYGILLEKGPSVRLTPLYDLTSALPYPDQFPLRKAKLAMRIGGQYQCARLQMPEWEKFATAHGITRIREKIKQMAERVNANCKETADEIKKAGIGTEIIDKLSGAIKTRSKSILDLLSTPPGNLC